MSKKQILLLTLIFGITSNIAIAADNQPKMKFFNKNSQSYEPNKEKFKKTLETKVSNAQNYPKIIQYFLTKYQADVEEVALWMHECDNSKEMCEYRDENEALNELVTDINRISKENELSSFTKTAQICARESYNERQTSACKDLARAYDAFRFHSQGIPEIRNIKSLDHQINTHYDDKYTVALLEKQKKHLQDNLKKTNGLLFNSLQNSSAQSVLDNNSSFFESLSEEYKQSFINIIEHAVCDKTKDFDNLAQEFQAILYVFHEKAARKHLNDTKALKELREDAARIRSHYFFPVDGYAQVPHLCELEWSNNKTSECKQLAQAYKNLRSYSSMHEIKEIHSLQDQINANSGILSFLGINSNNKPAITFLEEEKEKLEQMVKKDNNGHIPTNIPSYYASLAEKDQEELITIIKNVVRKKETQTDALSEEFQKIFNVFDEKL
ncbi:MAG TPA: hypothetical protein VKR54_05075 [Candidatus Babeliales bacterium]|jgi:hypothetical protein|nr:hypothetical protein [Candidatus Babeliales bacterium]